MKDGMLMQKWRPPTESPSQECSVIYQVVITQKYCNESSLQHIPMA